jgi:hypothetical protein
MPTRSLRPLVAAAGVVGAASVDFLRLGVLVVVMTLIVWAATAWYARLPAARRRAVLDFLTVVLPYRRPESLPTSKGVSRRRRRRRRTGPHAGSP